MTAWVTIDSDAVDGVELHTDGVPEFLTPPGRGSWRRHFWRLRGWLRVPYEQVVRSCPRCGCQRMLREDKKVRLCRDCREVLTREERAKWK